MGSFKGKHLFIAGPSRSGTTLLELVLSSHPRIFITPETYFIQSAFLRNFPANSSLNKKEWKWTLEQMKLDKKLASWPDFDSRVFIENLIKNPPERFSELLDRLFIEFAIIRGKELVDLAYIGNKRGIYASHSAYVKQLFPDAKFIYIFRDPRDAIVSMKKNIKQHTIETAIMEYNRIFRGALKTRGLYSKDVFIIKYEDLVLHPEKICKEICQFLNIKFDDRMLKFYEFNKNGKALLGVTKKIHKNTLKPFDSTLIQKWKKINIEKRVLNMIEVLNKESMDYFGYKSSNNVSFIESLIIYFSFYLKIFPLKTKSLYWKLKTTIF